MKTLHPSDFEIQYLKDTIEISFHGGKPKGFPRDFDELEPSEILREIAFNENNYYGLQELLSENLDAFLEIYKSKGELPFAEVANLVQDFLSDNISKDDFKEEMIDVLKQYSNETVDAIINSIPIYVFYHNFPGCLPENEQIFFVGHDETREALIENIKGFLQEEVEALFEDMAIDDNEEYNKRYDKLLMEISEIRYEDLSSLVLKSPDDKEYIHFERASLFENPEILPNEFAVNENKKRDMLTNIPTM